MYTRQEIIDAACSLTTGDLRELGRALEEKYGSDAARLLFGDVPAPGADYGRSVTGHYDVFLQDCGRNKIEVIKTIRELTHWGLYEAKQAADRAPGPIGFPTPELAARHFCDRLLKAGATAEIRPV
ncbi:MAG TPA: 50S ribosomal protein L7/L12 [Chthonomonadaceae bacterium]|nr:50S ribosomal protein L7/L12 [Chthonomonadaceae bacterium]